MADSCQNVATPKIIRAGQMEIGDKIQLEEEIFGIPGGVVEKHNHGQKRMISYENMTT